MAFDLATAQPATGVSSTWPPLSLWLKIQHQNNHSLALVSKSLELLTLCSISAPVQSVKLPVALSVLLLEVYRGLLLVLARNEPKKYKKVSATS